MDKDQLSSTQNLRSEHYRTAMNDHQLIEKLHFDRHDIAALWRYTVRNAVTDRRPSQ